MLRFRLMMVRWLWLVRHQAWFDAIDIVHDFINKHIDKAYADLSKTTADDKNENESFVDRSSERTDLLWSMIQHFGEDKERLRSELLVLFAPNNDTTSILISNVFWVFARRADVYDKVREEVISLGSNALLTYERLQSMKYLNAVLNESK